MSNIFVSGASGFIGGQLALDLLKDGHKVITILRDELPHPAVREMLKQFTVIKGDLLDYDLVRRVVADYEVEEVYHFASQAIVRTCAQDPISAYQNNVMGTVHLLEAVRTTGPKVRKVIVSTSDKAYGHAPPPYNEDTQPLPRFTYDATKACQDIACQNYFWNYGLPINVLRCANIYGPGDYNLSRIFPNSIFRCLRGEPPQMNSGVADYKREFLFIADAVQAFRLVAREAAPGENFCAGSGEIITIKELTAKIITACGAKLEPELIPKDEKFKELPEQWLSSQKLQALGWEASTVLTEGLNRTVEFYRHLIEKP